MGSMSAISGGGGKTTRASCPVRGLRQTDVVAVRRGWAYVRRIGEVVVAVGVVGALVGDGERKVRPEPLDEGSPTP